MSHTPPEGLVRSSLNTAIAPMISDERIAAARDGSWFQRGDEAPIDLSRRPVLRAVLAALIDAKITRPGTPVPANELIARVWPGDRSITLRNRLYVTVNTLRELGLRTAIVRGRDGYRIASFVRVARG